MVRGMHAKHSKRERREDDMTRATKREATIKRRQKEKRVGLGETWVVEQTHAENVQEKDHEKRKEMKEEERKEIQQRRKKETSIIQGRGKQRVKG